MSTERPRSGHAARPAGHGPGLGRRALPALAITGASGALMFALDHPQSTASAAETATAAGNGVTPVSSRVSSGVSTPAGATPATTPPTSTTGAPGSTAVAGTVPAAPSTTVAPATTTDSCSTFDGPTVATKWGPVQVEASVSSAGSICSTDAIVTPSGRRKSIMINQRAVPILDADAVRAQSANFAGVSGATITSNAYKQSLQAILDSVVTQ